ncbi:MAG: hypothetical protein GEU83_02885 [Pseudonocardiaceae bacterium]|nr:hypothetical protein [Pseudonocardiaceae bacterium]
MTRSELLSPAARIHVASLVVACAGFIILLVAGMPEFQPFPPGVIVLLAAAAAVVLLQRQRWVPLIGAALCLAITVGAFVFYDTTLERLADPADIVPFAGTVIQMGGVVVAMVTGVAAALRPQPTRQLTADGR